MKKNELTPQVEAKETWTKPELEIVSLKENTLAGGPGLFDLAVFS
ncbi:hypothetical protein [Aquirufa beregesia]|nr:hypothetical protein [Aquirufa beregesia]